MGFCSCRLTSQATFIPSRLTLSKKFFVYLNENPEKAKEQGRLLSSRLDKAVTKGVIPKGRADRKKSRIAIHLKKLMKTK